MYAYPRADTFVFVFACVVTDFKFVNIYRLNKVLPESIIPRDHGISSIRRLFHDDNITDFS